MKRALSAAMLLLLLILTCCVPALGASSAAVLTVTADGKNAVSAAVGSEVIFRVGLYAGETKIQNGQGTVTFDSSFLSLVEYAPDGDMESYSFPKAIYNSSLVVNYENKNTINYNFTKAKGIAVFNDPSALYLRFRFKVIAAGKTDISHVIRYMSDVRDVKIYNRGEINPDIDPYTVSSVEASAGRLGDADRDGEVTILDATLIQKIAAGDKADHAALPSDVNGDKAVSLRDALLIRRYLSGKPVSALLGTWQFASER